MARFCMFCGKEMPESAAFCPSCGAKQPIEEPTETPDVKAEEDDDKGESNAALDILSKANFSTKKQKGASGVIRVEAEKAEPKKVFDEEPEDRADESGEQVEEPVAEEFDDGIPDVELDDSDPEEYMSDAAIEKIAELEIMTEKGSASSGPAIIEGVSDEEDKKRLQEKIDEIKERGAGWSGGEYKKPSYQKRNLSEEDESDEYEAPQSMSTTSHIGSMDEMTADEKADLEKHKKYKEEEEKEKKKEAGNGEGRVKGEGRKSNGRKKDVRENIDKKIAERKVSDVEHEEAKDNSDPDYDGYYENVKPIDFDKQKDNTAVVKTALTGVAFIALASAVFYVLVTFFIQ